MREGPWYLRALTDPCPPCPAPDWLCYQCSIKSTVFVYVCDLCPKLWEILSTLFFIQITHRKGPLANCICRCLWLQAQLSFGLQRDIIRPVLSWDRERGPLCLSPAFRRVQPNLLMNCNSIAWSLDQSRQLPTSSFLHILNREAQTFFVIWAQVFESFENFKLNNNAMVSRNDHFLTLFQFDSALKWW